MQKTLIGIVIGATIAGAASALAQVYAEATTNGVMRGYIVQDARGRTICRDPEVFIQFRGQESYIICQ